MTVIMELEAPASPSQSFAKKSALVEWAKLLIQPAVALLLAAGVLTWAFGFTTLTDTQRETLNASEISTLLGQHVAITAVVTILVLLIAVPLGILVTRKGFRRLSPVLIGVGNIGQSSPAIGLLVLLFLWTGKTGFWIGVLPIAFYALLPVLRNTMLGIESVEPSLIDAGLGQGMKPGTVLRRVEFPLAVPFILAGLRTSLVLAVGTATLCFLVGAGGLGVLIDTGYKLRDNPTLFVGAGLAVALALFIDWLGALAERYLGPKGLN